MLPFERVEINVDGLIITVFFETAKGENVSGFVVDSRD